jgi:hypothetical protein
MEDSEIERRVERKVCGTLLKQVMEQWFSDASPIEQTREL